MVISSTTTPAAIIVMGVAGCGKSTVGEALADRLGWRFIEGDALHPPENVARMAAGHPLTDENREGWLDAIGQAITNALGEGDRVVATCSALKRKYRDRLRGWSDAILFVHVVIDKETARVRVGSRKGHFMPSSLVDSQFATLETPAADEGAVTVDGTSPLAQILSQVEAALNPRA